MIQYNDSYWADANRVLDHIPNLERLQGKTVFLTGGTGMICSAVTELLFCLNRRYASGVKLILGGRSKDRISRRFPGFREGTDYFYTYYDATVAQQLEIRADYMIHGASNANPTVYVKEPVETVLANVVGLNSLLSAAVNNHTQRVLYISSSEVYGKKTECRPYSEEDYGFVDILNPRASYPCSKRLAETLCVSYGQEYGLDTVIVRPGHIYGPSITDSDSRASAQFTRNAARGEDIVMKSAGTQLRSYCYTMDCASAILTVLLNGEPYQAYNISNRNSVVQIRDVAAALAKVANRTVIFETPSEAEQKGYNLMDNSSLDAQKLESLGWRGLFDLNKGTERTISYFRE